MTVADMHAMPARLKDAFITALIAAILALPLAGVRTEDGVDGTVLQWRFGAVACAAGLVFLGRLCLSLAAEGNPLSLLASVFSTAACFLSFPTEFLKTAAIGMGIIVAARFAYAKLSAAKVSVGTTRHAFLTRAGFMPSRTMMSCMLIAAAIIFPFTPFASRYALDVSVMVLTYIMLALGLNIAVGYAGLLDLGYAGFYALGAYCYALLAQHFGLGFWICLPVAGLLAAATGLALGAPVLRLRGDYFAVVTLGFGEIVRLVLINWSDFTGGPNGIADIPRPTLFGLAFTNMPAEGQRTFADYFHLTYSPMQRLVFLYFIALLLALAIGWFGMRVRRLPLGRAWESFREDEIACASLGIDRTWIKLAAYSLGALMAGIAGAFFAARQGFVSPESFTFTESATMLAIVILGGVGHPLGIVLATMFVIGLPELFRGFEQYRMIAFGLGMVLIMVWRPGGMMATREPTVLLPDKPDTQ
jgi:branched-chain amino acid transport system permease protein